MTLKKLLPTLFQRWRVETEEDQQRLVDWLKHKEPSLSASAWRSRIDEGLIWIDAQPVRLASRKLKAGSMVLTAAREVEPWRVLETVDSLVLLYKPPGVLFDEVNRHTQALGLSKIYPLHRLDKMTSGLLMVGLDPQTASEIDRSFKSQIVHKRYLAFCWGKPEANQGRIDATLMKKASYHGGAHVKACEGIQEGSLEASTAWRVLAHREGITLLECQPLSGRTHQIRAHLQSLGLPILGDLQYQKPLPPKTWWGNIVVTQQMLHAYSLQMVWKEKAYEWKAPLSLEFERLCDWIDPTGEQLGELVRFKSRAFEGSEE